VVIGSATKRRLRGTASELVRIGDCPVLVVKAEPTRMYQRPLVAVDEDVLSHRLIRLALAVVDPELDALGLVTVCRADIDADAAKVELARAEQRAARFVDDEAGVSLRLESRIRAGAPGQTIIEEANAVGADLVVLGSHLRSRMDRALFGGTGEHVVRDAPCDVLMSRPARPLR
jgi:nucleotide-binding universal stress UspA family protein